MENKERVCIFIDGSNFYHRLRKDIGDISVDLQKLSNELCGKDRRLIRTYYYNAPLDMI
ncbi:MAG: NYN domain-containing protein [Candidatus Aenigmarchaeota archaeon]|nr:NYN domain-containing protein [Candidatus Aenigmarchaeota archaeon]